jgi:hypothetical protein
MAIDKIKYAFNIKLSSFLFMKNTWFFLLSPFLSTCVNKVIFDDDYYDGRSGLTLVLPETCDARS